MEQAQPNTVLQSELIEHIPSGAGIYDVTGSSVNKIYLNDGYYQMIRSDRSKRRQYDGTATVNAIAPEDLPGLLREAHAAILEGRPFHYRFRVLDGMGGLRWIAILANHIPVSETTERFYAVYYDIDELIRTQEKLRDNELLFTETLKYSGTTHFIYYPSQHRYEAVALPDKYKKLPAAMDDYPESFIRFVGMPEEDAAAYRSMIRQIDEGADEAECTVQMMYLQRYSWYRVHCQSIFDRNGSVLRAIGSAVSVDRYKEAETVYLDKKLRMASLRGGLLSVTCVNATRDQTVETNDSGELHYGAPQDLDLLREAVAVEPEIARQAEQTRIVLLSAAGQIPDRQERARFLRAACHVGLLRLYESEKRETVLEYRRRTGRGLIWVSTRVSVMPDPETGDVLAFFYTTDINERMIFRKITNQIISQNFETVSYCDLTAKTLYLRQEDPLSERLFRPMPYDEAVLSAVRRYVADSEQDGVRAAFDLDSILDRLTREPVCTIYYTSAQRDETLPGRPYKRMKSDIFYLDENRDLLVFLQSNATAIFEQERANREQMAAALAAAERASQAKTQFLSRISHDIRTPLSAITSMTAFAREDMDDREKLSGDLDKIETSGRFLLSLINDILDISRIDSGNIELHPEPYPYAEYLAGIRNMFEPLCQQKGIRLSVSGSGAGGCILADRVRLDQIMLNLISNAIKYTPSGGSVEVTAGSTRTPEGLLDCLLEVRDSGIGMSRAFQKTMFEPFTQEHENPLRPADAGGTGLGLSLVRRITDFMGGSIEVESEQGRGTAIRVRFLFPEAPEKQPGAPEKHEPKIRLHGRVLLAEDNQINTEIAIRLLESRGLEVVCAKNGREAVGQFQNSRPGTFSAVLMDIQMPLMNGYEAAAALRFLPRADAKTVPIIAMTADAFASDVQKCLDAGMNAHIAKPIDPEKLFAILAEEMGRS